MKPTPDQSPYPLICLEETDSTNRFLTQLAREAENIPSFTIVSAEYQTAGKGQRGNSWESEHGKNLLFSLLLRPTFMEARKQFVLSQVVSLAIKEALDKYIDNVSIKWPNDIYHDNKKMCGILIEHQLEGAHIAQSICGVGININQEHFLSDAPNPISLKQLTGQTTNRHQLLIDIIQRIERYYQQLQQAEEATPFREELAANYTAALFRRHGLHRYRDKAGEFKAEIITVKSDGQLVLKDEEGEMRTYLFKEVQYIL